MVNGINLALQFLDSFAFIVLAAAGLAIIFGIMGVINLAHGEFILIGAYTTTLAVTQLGLPLVVAMVVGGVVTGIFGVITERVIISGAWPNWVSQRTLGRDVIQPLYDRLADSMVATFGLSLILTQGARIRFGNSIDQIATPFGAISYGSFSYSTYRIVLAGVSIGLLVATYYLFTRTDFGMRARATIQDKETAQAMGVNTDRMYMLTFGIGSALAGLTGALFAPVISMQPTLGDQFLVEAFVAVVVGGPSVVIGTALSGGVLGAILAVFSNLYGTFIGRIALLVAALIALRFLPDGITGFIEQVQKRRQESE
jgi:branched-chain amino acid transport system permease protein